MATTIIVAISAFMQVLDASIIGTALPQMGATFRVGPVDVGLGIIVFVLAASIVIPAAAWLADRFGAKRLFILSIGAFTVASILCGISQTLPLFVAARAVQGAAGAIMAATGQFILVRSVDRSDLLRLMNISSVPMLVGPVIGPPLGGLITETIGWQWIFYINVPVGVVIMLVAARFLNSLPIERRPFDLVGFCLNGLTLTLLVYGLERVTTDRSLGLAALGLGVLTGALAVRHLRRSAHPLLSLAPLRHLIYRITTLTALPLIRLPIGALLFVLPILLQIGFGMSALLSGLALLAHAAGDLLMKLFTTRVIGRFGYRTVLAVSSGATAIGIGACALLTQSTPYALILVLLFVSGCARSFVMTGLTTLSYDPVQPAEMQSAVTIGQITLQVAAALSVSLAMILFDLNHVVKGVAGDAITAEDCRIVLVILALIGLASVPALLRLPRNAGDGMSGRARPAMPIEE